jgi:cyclic-di-GMP-binding protein
MQMKAAKRNLSLKIFDYGKVESSSGKRVRQEITLKRGLISELAKQIPKLIREFILLGLACIP